MEDRMPAIGEAKTGGGRTVKGNFKLLTEVSKELDISRSRILRWINDGKVENVKLYKNQRGYRLIEEKDIGILREYRDILKPQN